MNPAQYTGLKDPCPATRSVAAHTSASASAPTAQPAVGLRQPGANPSGWSDGLLELFLRHVDRADLASCRSVCRSWHEAGASDSLQLDCFLNGWQPRALQPLLQAAARQLPPTASLVEVRRCLYRLIQERLQAPRFSARHLTVVEEPSMSESVDELRFSPDGQFAAMSFYGTGGWADELQYCCSLYSMRAGQFHREYHCVQNLPLQGLLFGADSRSLQAVDTSGQLHEWQCCSDGHWQAREPVPLGPPAAHKVLASPDGSRLALVDAGTDPRDSRIYLHQPVVFLLDKTDSGDWTTTWQWRCPRPFLRTGCRELADLCFSDDSRVFVFTAAPHVFVCQRRHERWTLQPLDAVCDLHDQATLLAPDGKTLAVYDKLDGSYSCPPRANIEVWQQDEQHQWAATGQYVCAVGSIGAGAMAFSPDSQQLVFPDDSGQDNCRLCLLSATDTGVFRRSATLQLPAVSDRPTSGLGFSRVKRLHFGATGAHLCAITHEGLHLWRRGAQREDWRPAGWVNEEDTAGARCGLGGLFLGGGAGGGGGVPGGQLSPDGSHCVLFGDRRGRCSVWGPDHSGRYRKKVSIEPGRRLYKVQFTPDASQLLLAFEGDFVSQGRRAPSGLACLTLVPEPDSASDRETGSGAQPPQTDAGFQTAERTVQQAL